jgi:hypothetical protein
MSRILSRTVLEICRLESLERTIHKITNMQTQVDADSSAESSERSRYSSLPVASLIDPSRRHRSFDAALGSNTVIEFLIKRHSARIHGQSRDSSVPCRKIDFR